MDVTIFARENGTVSTELDCADKTYESHKYYLRRKRREFMAQLWGGRFTKETDQLVYNFNASISFDQKFYEQDIQGSIAHVYNACESREF